MTASYWKNAARFAILSAHAAMPDDMAIKDRIKIIDAAYPFGQRAHHPYKCWLVCRREYIARVTGQEPKSKALIESPMERQKRRYDAAMGAKHE